MCCQITFLQNLSLRLPVDTTLRWQRPLPHATRIISMLSPSKKRLLLLSSISVCLLLFALARDDRKYFFPDPNLIPEREKDTILNHLEVPHNKYPLVPYTFLESDLSFWAIQHTSPFLPTVPLQRCSYARYGCSSQDLRTLRTRLSAGDLRLCQEFKIMRWRSHVCPQSS